MEGTYVHMDVDTTVMPVFGEHEGALPGPNPRYRGRPSFHPMVARIAETATIIGGELRAGNTGFGDADVPVVRAWAVRARDRLRKGVSLCVRVDSAGDCGQLMKALHQESLFYLFKARITGDLLGVVAHATGWKTVDGDAEGAPCRQVATLDFRRDTWGELTVRVIAVRSVDRHGRQLPLFEGGDWTVQVFLTNRVEDADDIAWDYDGRAGIEPHIGELKGAWGIGEASCYSFTANHAAFLLKLLSHNLLHRYVATTHLIRTYPFATSVTAITHSWPPTEPVAKKRSPTGSFVSRSISRQTGPRVGRNGQRTRVLAEGGLVNPQRIEEFRKKLREGRGVHVRGGLLEVDGMPAPAAPTTPRPAWPVLRWFRRARVFR